MGGITIRSHFALAAAALACLAGSSLAQPGATSVKRTEAQYAGGFNPRACVYPKPARSQGLSGCCQMDLEIDAQGRVLAVDGVCSDPVFLQPTRRCLSAQAFVPATQNGVPVRDLQHLEYEWRATGSKSLCPKMRTS